MPAPSLFPRSRWWPALAAAAVFAGLLFALCEVLLQAVHKGEERRSQLAVHAATQWRCGIEHGTRLRDACLAQALAREGTPSYGATASAHELAGGLSGSTAQAAPAD